MEQGLTYVETKEKMIQRAELFASHYDEKALKSNDIRMKAPMVFVLLGDKVQEGTEEIQKAVECRVSNSEGIVYLSVTSHQATNQLPNKIVIDIGEKIQENRGEISKLLDSDTFLEHFNQRLSQLTQCVLEKNKVFSYWEQIHVCVITEASDSCSVLLPDLMVLLRNKLEQNFKQVFADLFVLLDETSEMATPMNKALAYSLFEELDLYESVDYHYARPIELVEGKMKLMTSYKGKLFHLVYVLSDKKENGQRIQEARKNQYESIVAINLLKNREQKAVELEEAREQYQYNAFMTNIRESAQHRYATARLARVRKPGQGIYLTVLYCLFKAYKEALFDEGQEIGQAFVEQMGLSEHRIEEQVSGFFPDRSALDEIRSLISTHVDFKTLKNMSFKEAENTLYGETAHAFFDENFKKVAKCNIAAALSREKVSNQLSKQIIEHMGYGPFALEQFLTSDAHETIERQKEKYSYQMKAYEVALEEKENALVGKYIGGSFALFDKKYLQEVKTYLIEKIYSTKYAYEKEKLKLEVLQGLQQEIEHFYEDLKEKLKKLSAVENILLESMKEASRYEEDYLVQNVKEYYERVVQWQLEALKKVKGEHFLQDEKYMGACTTLLEESEQSIISKLCQIAEQEILNEEKYFNLAFEEELLARANMHVTYVDTEVVAKTELYELLYESLEENSKPCVYLDTAQVTYRYVEKYFIADKKSEFTSYAYKRDQSSRNYKIGTVSDKRTSVIEKLQLMGGFRLQDLIYTRAAKRYYEAYKEKQYIFHSEEVEKSLGVGVESDGDKEV